MRDRLEVFKDRKFVGVTELAATAQQILENSDSQQERGTVREYPDERTVRFYLSEGLIPPAIEKQGTASVFGYIHLLALITVKKLQAESLPIRKIREIISHRDANELEKLLGVDTAENKKDKNQTKNEAQQFLEKLLVESREPKRETEGILFSRAKPLPPAQAANPGPVQRWKRIEIAQGVELHIEESFKAPSDLKEMELFIERIRQVIRSAGRK